MDGLSAAILRRLRGGTVSRNRSPNVFACEAGRRALRSHRVLLSLERDLAAVAALARVEVRREPTAEGKDAEFFVLHIILPSIHGRRSTRLAAWEYEQLCEDPRVSARIIGARPPIPGGDGCPPHPL